MREAPRPQNLGRCSTAGCARAGPGRRLRMASCSGSSTCLTLSELCQVLGYSCQHNRGKRTQVILPPPRVLVGLCMWPVLRFVSHCVPSAFPTSLGSLILVCPFLSFPSHLHRHSAWGIVFQSLVLDRVHGNPWWPCLKFSLTC